MTMPRLSMLACAAVLAVACSSPASRSTAAPSTPTTEGAVAAVAGTDAESAPAVAAAPTGDPVICKRVIPTGTRVAQRTCKRRSEIEQQQRAARESTEMIQRRGVQTGNPTTE